MADTQNVALQHLTIGVNPDKLFDHFILWILKSNYHLLFLLISFTACRPEGQIFLMKNLGSTILEYLAAGESVENILEAYPILEPEDIKAALEFVKW